MIEPSDFLRVAIDPGMRFLSSIMGKEMGADPAKVILLAIAMQETGLEHRRQIDANGKPLDTLARGWFQFEAGGGVQGVCTHAASKDAAAAACAKLHVPFNNSDIHESLAWHDQLAAIFARLLLYTDSAPLPAVGDEQGAWDYYIRNWRPGKPHRERWAKNYPLAISTVTTAAAMAATMVPFIQPKPGTLTTKSEGGVTQVDLPEMNRSWKTGDYWLSVGSGVLAAAIPIALAFEPVIMERLGSSVLLASLPLGLGVVVRIAAREWYKGQRIKYAAEVAAASARQNP